MRGLEPPTPGITIQYSKPTELHPPCLRASNIPYIRQSVNKRAIPAGELQSGRIAGNSRCLNERHGASHQLLRQTLRQQNRRLVPQITNTFQ